MNKKQKIVAALRAWVAQRPGLDPRNYISGGGSVEQWKEGARAYRAKQRAITRDRHHAERLIDAVAAIDSINAAALLDAFKSGYSGRLSWNGERLEYRTGQYRPTEYRRAVCAVCATALWQSEREKATLFHYPGSVDDKLRAHFRHWFGRDIARRFFD